MTLGWIKTLPHSYEPYNFEPNEIRSKTSGERPDIDHKIAQPLASPPLR
jgi:hypothetical protein